MLREQPVFCSSHDANCAPLAAVNTVNFSPAAPGNSPDTDTGDADLTSIPS